MANFTDYEAPTMSSNDFTLYPYSEVWSRDQTYLPTTNFSDAPYITATTFDSYQAQQAYAPPDQYCFPIDPSLQLKSNIQRASPSYSPANSASHSFELHNPPNLSNSSDSGASVQSSHLFRDWITFHSRAWRKRVAKSARLSSQKSFNPSC